MKRFWSLLLAGVLLCNLAGCGHREARPPLVLPTPTVAVPAVFSSEASPVLTLTAAGAQEVQAAVEKVDAGFAYEALYDLEAIYPRLQFDASVTSHRHCALNSQGLLDPAWLAALVKANNQVFLQEHTYSYSAPDDAYLAELCGFIIQVITQMEDRYPELDWPRVYCNLGNLKILYRAGTLAYAQVSKDQVLSISESNTNIILTLKGEDGFSRVLAHEVMHLIQLGCPCEEIQNAERRAGISMYWDDHPAYTTDWTWFVEGAAERYMCRLTGRDAVSYQYKMDYLCSFNLAILLREENRADAMEYLSFQQDPQLLFEVFGCRTRQEQDEVLLLMITTNVLQSQPDGFYDALVAAGGTDPRESDAAMDAFSYALKPSICIALAKAFYTNLVPALETGSLTVNDLFFLLNLFEGHLNQHLRFTEEERRSVNAPFLTAYTAMREALFQALAADNGSLELEALYAAYEIGGNGSYHGTLSMLPPEKRKFLAERARWQEDLLALGVKVP